MGWVSEVSALRETGSPSWVGFSFAMSFRDLWLVAWEFWGGGVSWRRGGGGEGGGGDVRGAPLCGESNLSVRLLLLNVKERYRVLRYWVQTNKRERILGWKKCDTPTLLLYHTQDGTSACTFVCFELSPL